MAFCKNCGAEIDDNASMCPKCGAAQKKLDTTEAPKDTGGFGWGLLGFLIPLVGIILFFVWKKTKPKSSKAAGIGALIGIIIGVVYYIFVFSAGVSMLKV